MRQAIEVGTLSDTNQFQEFRTAMSRHATIAAALLATLALSHGASAADLPMPPSLGGPVATFAWTGFYVGANAGYVFDSSTKLRTTTSTSTGSQIATRQSPSLSDDGVVAGGQIGYNYQFGQFVAGVEADIDYTDLAKTGPLTAGVPVAQGSFRAGLDYLGTVRGRLGYAFGSAMVYGTGGLAYGDAFAKVNGTGSAAQGLGRTVVDDVKTGYAAGGGIEFAMGSMPFVGGFGSGATTVRVEALHYDLGNSTFAQGTTASGAQLLGKVSTSGTLARVGVNQKF